MTYKVELSPNYFDCPQWWKQLCSKYSSISEDELLDDTIDELLDDTIRSYIIENGGTIHPDKDCDIIAPSDMMDGRVGEITVSNAGGSVTLTKAFEATMVTTFESSPSKPVILNLSLDQIDNMLIVSPPDQFKNNLEEEDSRANILDLSELDIDYLKNKMFAALKIPKQHLGYLEDGNSKATLAAMDMRFAKTIERFQRIIVDGLEKIAIAHLYSQGIDDSELTNFELQLTLPSVIYEQEKINLWTMKMDLIQKMDQLKVISKDWIYKNILNFTYEEAELQKEALLDDAVLTHKITNIEQFGNEKGQDQPPQQAGDMGSDETGQPMQADVDTDEPPVEDEEQPQEGPINVEDQIAKLKQQLGGQTEEGVKPTGRPKDYSTRGKDKSPFGRDVLGNKEYRKLSTREGYLDYIKTSITKGGSKIISEGKSMLDEENIIEN